MCKTNKRRRQQKVRRVDKLLKELEEKIFQITGSELAFDPDDIDNQYWYLTHTEFKEASALYKLLEKARVQKMDLDLNSHSVENKLAEATLLQKLALQGVPCAWTNASAKSMPFDDYPFPDAKPTRSSRSIKKRMLLEQLLRRREVEAIIASGTEVADFIVYSLANIANINVDFKNVD